MISPVKARINDGARDEILHFWPNITLNPTFLCLLFLLLYFCPKVNQKSFFSSHFSASIDCILLQNELFAEPAGSSVITHIFFLCLHTHSFFFFFPSGFLPPLVFPVAHFCLVLRRFTFISLTHTFLPHLLPPSLNPYSPVPDLPRYCNVHTSNGFYLNPMRWCAGLCTSIFFSSVDV